MKNNIRLAFISSYFGIGGVPKTFLNIASKLNGNGFSFHFISPGSDEFQHKFEDSGECFYSIDPREILNYLNKNKIDIAQTINCEEGSYLAYLAGVPRIIERQDGITSAFAFDKTPIDCIISSTYSVYKKTKEEFPHKKVELIYNGVDTSVFSPDKVDQSIKESLGITPTDTIIGYCGRLSREKCLDKLIYTVYQIINEDKISTVKLIIMGNHHNDGYLEYLKTISAPLKDNVIFLDGNETPEKFMGLFDIGVLCSGSYKDKSGNKKITREGLSNSIMELMAMGIPIVATDSGETSSLVKDNQTGFVVAINDLDSLRKKIVELIKNPQIGKKFGEKGREFISDHFNIDSMVNHYESLYRYILKRQFIKDFPDTRKGIGWKYITRPFEWNIHNIDSPSFLILRSGNEKLFNHVIDDIRWHFRSARICVLCKDEHKNLHIGRNVAKTFTYGETALFEAGRMNGIISDLNKENFDCLIFLTNDLLGKGYGNIFEIAEKIDASKKIAVNNLYKKYLFQ